MSVTPRDRLAAYLFDKDGVTRLAWLRNARNIQWMEVNSKAGWGTFEIPLDDDTTSQVFFDRIVRLVRFYQGVPIAHFPVRIRSETMQLAADGRRWLRFEQQPGLLGMLADATVYPEGGFAADAPTTRNYGFMSPDGPWRVPSDWITPHGQAWTFVGGDSVRAKRPPDFKGVDENAQWISARSPNANQDAFKSNYVRGVLHLDETSDVEILHTADNYLMMYIDGQLASSWGPPDIWQWLSGHTVTQRLSAGDHLIASRVQNARKFAVVGNNSIAFIATIRKVKPDGTTDPAILLHTDTANWTAHDGTPEPGWHRAQVLLDQLQEAQDRSVSAVLRLGHGFTTTRDSNGNLWTDRGQFSFDVNQTTLLDVAAQLSEHEMDVWVKPHTMRIQAAKRRGRDKSATVQLQLGKDGGGLKSHEVSSVAARFTVILAQAADGQMIEVVDHDAIDAGSGRIEVGMSLGSADTAGSAAYLANRQLEANSTGKDSVVSQHSTLTGAVFGKDYGIGDTITVPGRRDVGTMKARVLGALVDGTGEIPQVTPLYVGDTSV